MNERVAAPVGNPERVMILKRNTAMLLRFTKAEMDTLTKKARKSGRSREGYCRTILNGSTVKETPHADFYGLMREVKRVGSNIDQILKVANTKGFLDVPALRKALDEWSTTEKMLWDTFRPTDK